MLRISDPGARHRYAVDAICLRGQIMGKAISIQGIVIIACGVFITRGNTNLAWAQDSPEPSKVMIEADGTVQVPSHSVPLSSLLSPEAKAYVTEHLKNMQDPELLKQDNGVPRFMRHYLERDEA